VSRADGGRALGAWLGVVAIWSTTPLAIKWTAEGLGPIEGIAGRTLIGAAIFLLAFLTPWLKFDHRPATWRAAGIAAGFAYVSMLLLYAGAPAVPSGLMSVVYGATPLTTALLAVFVWRSERLTAAKAVGVLLGVGGIALIFGDGASLGPGALGGLGLLAASMCINCINMLVLKQVARDLPVMSFTAASVWLTAPALVLTWWLADGELPAVVADRDLLAMAWLGVMGTVIGFICFYYALKHLQASTVALIMVVTPVTALLLGHFANGERLPPMIWIGSLMVLAGIACAALLDPPVIEVR
jgi:drug/metabolite transporter (DMT)-like permease